VSKDNSSCFANNEIKALLLSLDTASKASETGWQAMLKVGLLAYVVGQLKNVCQQASSELFQPAFYFALAKAIEVKAELRKSRVTPLLA
jgi:hypothetical protein